MEKDLTGNRETQLSNLGNSDTNNPELDIIKEDLVMRTDEVMPNAMADNAKAVGDLKMVMVDVNSITVQHLPNPP